MDGLIDTAARALIASPFLVSALDKTLRPEAARAEISAMAGRAGFAVPAGPALGAVLAVQWIGGLGVLVPQWAPYGAALLIAFLVAVTFAAHAFWTFPAEERAMKRDHFFGNVAILGGLLLVLARVL
jgi:uncharacterized membrane protein YphA (DoxX/SURF4 family)